MHRWARVNKWTGIIVFGFPLAVGILAATQTVNRFGLAGLVAAALPLVVVALPLLLWAAYCRRATPSARRRWSTALVVASVVSAVLLTATPIGVWNGPNVAVLLSELARLVVVVHSHRTRGFTSPTPSRVVSGRSDL